MLEKSSAQNIATCENQGKQHELSGHWNQLKHHFWKKKRKTGNDTKKTKQLTEIQVLSKEFTSNKIRYVFKKREQCS